MIYLFLAPDEYLLAERLAQIKAGLGDPELAGLNTVDLAGASTGVATVLAEASTMPFLTSRRLVIVRGLLDHLERRLAASTQAESAAHQEAALLLEGLGALPDSSDLVFVDNSVDKRRILWKGGTLPAARGRSERKVAGLEALVKAGTVRAEELAAPDPKSLPVWIQQRARARAIAIDGGAVAVLADLVGPNLRQLDNELEKLALYAFHRTITPQDVRAMVADAGEEMIWNLTDALGQRNARGAMRALRELRRNDQNPIGLIAAIARQYRLLLQVKTLLDAGMGDRFEIAKRLGEKPFPVEKAMRLAGRYPYAEIESILERLLEADAAMKSGADQDTEIDVVVAELTLPPAAAPARARQPAR
jgi:DNA polymerase-3 subunit delta